MAPQLTVRKNGGSPQTGAITCAFGDSIRVRLASTGTVRSCRFEIYGYPSGWSAPSGWTEDTESRVIYADGVSPSDFTLPVELTWGKWLLRAIVDGETDDGVTALEITSAAGLHATPAGEGGQFGGSAQKWGKHLEANWRTLETALAGSGASLAGDVSGLAGANTVGKIRNINVDFEGDPSPGDGTVMVSRVRSGTTSLYFEFPYTPRVYYDQGVTASPPYDNVHFPVLSTWTEAREWARSLAIVYGSCELVVTNRTTSLPQIPTGTYTMAGVILRGENVNGGRVALSLAAGVKFRDPYRFENLSIENDQAASLFDTTGAAALSVAFVDCDLSDVGAGDYWASAPASSSNSVEFTRSSFSGATPFINLADTRTLTVTGHDAVLARMADGEGGSSLTVLCYGATSYTTDGAYGGTLSEQWIVAGGSKTVSVAGSGSTTLTEAQAAADEITFAGTLTGARTLTLPAGARRRTIRNATDGDYTLRVQGTGGGFTYLLPGQTRTVTVGTDDVMRGEALAVMELAVSISLAGDTVGNHATTLAALPANTVVDRCEVLTLTSTSGGTSKSSVGNNASTYDNLLTQATTPTAGSDPLGKASTSLGSAMSADGAAFFATAGTVKFNHNVTSATVSAGKVRVLLAAHYLGELPTMLGFLLGLRRRSAGWTPAQLPAGVLKLWASGRVGLTDLATNLDGSGAVDGLSDSSVVGRQIDRAAGNNLLAAGVDRLVAGYSAKGRGISLFTNARKLISTSSVSGVRHCFAAISFVGPNVTRSSGDDPACFSNDYQSYIAGNGITNPAGAIVVGNTGTNQLLTASGLESTVYLDGTLSGTADVGRQRIRRVVRVSRSLADMTAGQIIVGAYGTTYILPSLGAVHEVVLLSSSATSEHLSLVQSYMDWHRATPVVMCSLDSLSACVNIATYDAWPALLWSRYRRCVSVANLGIPGQSVTTAISGDPAKIDASKGTGTNVLVLLGGANDLFADDTAATVWGRLQTYITMAKARGCKVLLCSLPPGVAGAYWNTGRLAQRVTLNGLIAAGWAAAGADGYADLSGLSLTLQADGVHFTTADAALVGTTIGTALDALL